MTGKASRYSQAQLKTSCMNGLLRHRFEGAGCSVFLLLILHRSLWNKLFTAALLICICTSCLFWHAFLSIFRHCFITSYQVKIIKRAENLSFEDANVEATKSAVNNDKIVEGGNCLKIAEYRGYQEWIQVKTRMHLFFRELPRPSVKWFT